MRVERVGGDRGSRHVDVRIAIKVPVGLRHGERVVRMRERGDKQERAGIAGAGEVEDRPLGHKRGLVVEVELVGANADAGLTHRAHVVIPARAMLGLIPVRRPTEVGGINVGRQPVLESVQLIGPAEMHLAGEDRAIAADPQAMGEGRNVGRELRRIVVDARVRRQEAGHEGRARGRAKRTVAIGAVEDDAASRQRLNIRRAGEGMAVDRQARRRHLIGDDDENVGRFGSHRAAILLRPL